MVTFYSCIRYRYQTYISDSSMNNKKDINRVSRIIKGPRLDYTPDPRGVGYVFFTQMKKHTDKIVQIDVSSGEEDSFSSLLQRCVRTAIGMRSKGVVSGDIISICSLNHLNSIVPFVAGLFIGAKIASLHPSLCPNDMKHLIKQITPKIIFVAPQTVELITEVLKKVSPMTQVVVFGETEEYTAISDFLRPHLEEDNFKPFQATSARDTAIIYFSSGTSGLPKGICLSHYALLSQFINLINYGICWDTILGFAPMYWITSALFWGVVIIQGTTKLLIREFHAELAWKTIGRYKPTFMFLAPNQMLAMLAIRKTCNVDTRNLKDIYVGGASIPHHRILEARSVFSTSRVSLVYGQTEACGFATCFRSCSSEEIALMNRKTISCGRAIPGVNIKVVDLETDQVLGPNQRGELRLKTEFQLNGYYDQDSAEIWDAEDWLQTGDVGYYDEDGCFYVVDRIKEMLKFRSWHVPPAIIENVLMTHPSVDKAVVVGIPHEVDVDHPIGVVKLKQPTKMITPEEIEKYVEDRVDEKYRLRGGVKFMNNFPMTPTGKINRYVVKQIVLKELL